MAKVYSDPRNGHVGMANIPFDFVPEKKKKVRDNKLIDPMLEAVFSADSTGHPCSSAMVYLERDTRPEVKDWIVKNLYSSPVNDKGYPVEQSDEMLALMRGINESEKEYRDRLVSTAKTSLGIKED